MLTSFLIKNFRFFRHLASEHFGRVNLIVGRNNSGKSALLEAIELYAHAASPNVLRDLIMRRQESWSGQTQTPNESTTLHPVRHLFFNHQLPEIGEEGITIGPIEPTHEQMHIVVGIYYVARDEAGIMRRVPVPTLDLSAAPAEIEFFLTVQQEGRTRRLLRLDRDFLSETSMLQRPPGGVLATSRYVTQVVPTRNMTEEKIASLWDAIYLTGLDDEVVKGLQLIEKNITGIGFVEDKHSRNSRVPLVKLHRVAEPLPLRSLGDGVIRLFHIIVALANARNGILLVDEFENGLHWSVQPKIWESVFRLAQTLNVQVFATTHSRDCISSFESVWQNRESEGVFLRLNADMGTFKSVTRYTHETLVDALETDVEVR